MQAARVVRDRGGLVEAEHIVRVAVWRPSAGTAAGGDENRSVYLRSAAKPVQALAVQLSGAAVRFAFGDRELALACGSHSGEPIHAETAADMLARAGLDKTALCCGSHPPVHGPSADDLVRAGTAPSALHNNCSGKHAGMLAACVAAGWTTADYVLPDHPLQRLNRRNVAAFTGIAESAVRVGVDGCSVPVFGVPLGGSARLAALVAAPTAGDLPADLRDAALRIGRAMRSAPHMVGGTGRCDTDLMRVTGGAVTSKVGAEGLWCIGIAARRAGLAVKCEDGSSDAARRVGLTLLRASGVLDDDAWDALHAHHDAVVRNHRQLDVGRIHVELPPGLAEALS